MSLIKLKKKEAVIETTNISSATSVVNKAYVDTQISGANKYQRLAFQLYTVKDIFTTNQIISNTLINSNGDGCVLTEQTTNSENGYYTKSAGVVSKQTLTYDSIFIDTDNNQTAYFDGSSYIKSKIRTFEFEYRISTTNNTTNNLFTVPIINDNETHIDVKFLGYVLATPTRLYFSELSDTFFDIDGSIIQLEKGFTTSKITHTSLDNCTSGIDDSLNIFVQGVSGVDIEWLVRGSISI